jgi:Bacterial capsule synthesis protein PGA_cap
MIYFKQIPQRITFLLSTLMILLGAGLLTWLLFHLPTMATSERGVALAVGNSALDSTLDSADATNAESSTDAAATESAEQSPNADPITTAETPIPVVVGLADGLPTAFVQLVSSAALSQSAVLTAPTDAVSVTLRLSYSGQEEEAVYAYTFAAATRFDTIDTTLPWDTVQTAWRGNSGRFSTVVVLSDTVPALTHLLGAAGPTLVGYATQPEVIAAAWAEPAADLPPPLVLLPFDLLDPRLAVFTIDGQNPIENANKFEAEAYPLTATIYAQSLAKKLSERQAVDKWLDTLPVGNRDPDRLTVVAMTGVTAIVRLTAKEVDARGPEWLAEVVGPELAAADITAISNEVPFVPGCETNTDMGNLTFCSKPEYMAALTASGVDIIGLTGNHQNDYGREDAVKSLDIYEKAKLPVYGGGRNKEEAFAPHYLEHNGNRLAFLGANSYGPQFAWATDDKPGSAQFDLNIMSATLRNIRELGRAEVILAELQYQESYDVVPLFDQRQNFNALIRAGADIVTGVQSHVPQAMEFTEGKLVLYGLGNLFFDQMWSQSTREGMIVKHTIYNNRHISTQVFTTLLYDYGQPRWATPEERESILQRVYGASYWEQ